MEGLTSICSTFTDFSGSVLYLCLLKTNKSFYFRLSPALLATILFYVGILKKLGDGLMWPLISRKFAGSCLRSGWATLFYLTNFLPLNRQVSQVVRIIIIFMQNKHILRMRFWKRKYSKRYSFYYPGSINVWQEKLKYIN